MESVAKLSEEVNKIQSQIDKLNKNDPEKKLREFSKVVSKLENKIERLSKENIFLNSNDSCPTCSQSIDTEFKDSTVIDNLTEIDKFSEAIGEAQEHLDRLDFALSDIGVRKQELLQIQKNVFEHETQIKSYKNSIKEAADKILAVEMDTRSMDKEEGILIQMQQMLKDMKGSAAELVSEVENHEIVLNLLKDSGIKAQIVRKYLPAMNQYIRKYLTELELPIHFILDEEFNESVSSPLHQDFSYASFSEGQKSRIDLALMLTWREIGKLKNSVTTNLLILDEVFSSSLDDVGKDNLLRILRYKIPDDQRVVVVDHTLSDSFKEKFDSNIEVSLQGGFSRYN